MTVCEADSTTSMESDSTVCYNSNSDSDKDSVFSGPMFIEDVGETDDELPQVEVPDVECTSREHGAAGGAATAGACADICSQTDKCECQQDNNAEEVFFLFFSFFSSFC